MYIFGESEIKKNEQKYKKIKLGAGDVEYSKLLKAI